MKKYNKIETYEEFVQYCLRRLGAPVLNIEVADEQLRDRITDALQYYIENHYESEKEFFWLYTVTKNDVERGYILMPPHVLDVTDIQTSGLGVNFDPSEILGNMEYSFLNNYIWSLSNTGYTGLIYYEMSMQHLNVMNKVLNAEVQFSWRTREKKIYLYKELREGRLLIIRGYQMLNPETDDCIWDSDWLKRYATALIGIQWGTNLSKFGAIPSVSGITLNGDEILNRYTNEKMDLETEFRSRFEYPPMFYIG